MIWNYIVIACCLFLLAFLVRQELKRPNRLRLAWRLLASVLAMAALLCMAIPLTMTQTVHNKGGEAVLLTEGFVKDSLSAYKELPFYTADKDIFRDNTSFKVKYIPGFDLFIGQNPSLKKLYILGYGLSEAELAQIKNIQLHFHPSPYPRGISDLHWQKKIRLGETLHLQGQFNNPTSGKLKLVLKGLGSSLDSALIFPNARQQIELKTAPKHLGRALYQLIGLSGRDTIETEEIPVEIEPQETFKILLLASSPGFENRFLKTWLYQNGYPLAIRTTISKDRFNTEFLNTPSVRLNNINASILQKFDLVIADMGVLSSLRPAEASALKIRISSGLGLVMITGSAAKTSFFTKQFLTYPSSSVQKSISLKLPAGNSIPVGTEQPVYIRAQPGIQQIIRDTKGNILAGSKLIGTGKILLSTMTNTYTWTLAGNKDDYSSFWSLILEKAVQKGQVSGRLAIAGSFPSVDEQARIMAENLNAGQAFRVGGSPISPVQDRKLPFQWNGTFWPTSTGWNSIERIPGKPIWQFIYTSSGWKPAKARLRTSATQEFVKNQPVIALFDQKNSKTGPVPVPKSWFFFLFLIACSYLWYEQK